MMRRSGEGWPGWKSRCKGLEAGIGLGGLRSACRVGGGLVARDELQELGGFPSTSFFPFRGQEGRVRLWAGNCI